MVSGRFDLEMAEMWMILVLVVAAVSLPVRESAVLVTT